MAVFFDTSTSSDDTIQAIKDVRSVCGKDCFVTGMSALVTDLKDLCEKEEAIYVGIAVACCLVVMMILLDSFVAPILFLVSIGMAILYNLGSNIFLGEISYITKLWLRCYSWQLQWIIRYSSGTVTTNKGTL